MTPAVNPAAAAMTRIADHSESWATAMQAAMPELYETLPPEAAE